MKIEFDTKKGAEVLGNVLSKTTSFGKKAVEEVQKNAAAMTEKSREENYQRRLKKYNPLFPDVYHSESFCLPKMIVVVDASVRQGIDVCEGSVGWLDTENGMEVLYLYTEIAKESGLNFYPLLDSSSVYYVDNFDSKRFIRSDCIFSKAHEERMAELKHIAHSLGAKSCTIEISETISESTASSKKFAMGGSAPTALKFNLKGSSENSIARAESFQRSGHITAQFEGSDSPKRPKLKWFAQDENIKRLIDMRCKKANNLKSETLQLSGATSATITQKAAIAMDGALGKISMKSNSAMETKAAKESTSTLIFSVEF